MSTLQDDLRGATVAVTEAKGVLLGKSAELDDRVSAAEDSLSKALRDELNNVATGSFRRFVSVEGDDSTADLTRAKPFLTVSEAVKSTPAGSLVEVELLAAAGVPEFDFGAAGVNLSGRILSITYGGNVIGDRGVGAVLKFRTVINPNERVGAVGIYGPGSLYISDVTIVSDDIPNDVGVANGWFTNTHLSLFVKLWNTTVKCSRVPVFGVDVGGEFQVSLVNSVLSKSSEDAVLASNDWGSSISVVTGGYFLAEGAVTDYFQSGAGDGRVKWNRSLITGTL